MVLELAREPIEQYVGELLEMQICSARSQPADEPVLIGELSRAYVLELTCLLQKLLAKIPRKLRQIDAYRVAAQLYILQSTTLVHVLLHVGFRQRTSFLLGNRIYTVNHIVRLNASTSITSRNTRLDRSFGTRV